MNDLGDGLKAKPKISAFVICCNEEDRIGRCLKSLQFCDEIVVVDSGSKDRTLEICRNFQAKIFENPWPGNRDQKQFALNLCQFDWVLNIDSDEEISPELRKEIEEILATEGSQNPPKYFGYELLRVVFHFDKWWRKGGWYPEYRLRLLYRTATSWGGRDPHEKAIVEGAVRKLRGELYHFSFRSFEDQVKSTAGHALVSARALHQEGRPSSLVAITLHPLLRFIKFYFLRKGFLEGFPGLAMAILESYGVFLKYAFLWDLNRKAKRTEKRDLRS